MPGPHAAPVVGLALPAAPPTATGLRRRPSRRATDAALPDHATPCLPVRGTRRCPQAPALAPARARHPPPRWCWGLGPPPRPRKPDGAQTAPARVHGTTGRHRWQHDRCLGPRLPSSLRRTGGAAMPTRTRCVLPGGGVPGLLFPCATPGNQAAQQQPNARGEPRPIAAATQERRLLGVGSTAMLGWVCPVEPRVRCRSLLDAHPWVCFLPLCPRLLSVPLGTPIGSPDPPGRGATEES